MAPRARGAAAAPAKAKVKAKAKSSPQAASPRAGRKHAEVAAERAAAETAASPGPLPRPAAVDAKAVAREVLRLGSLGQHEAVLRVLGDPVGAGAAGGSAAARKAFLRISMLIHPDKLSGFPEATKAFQMLVSAFDRTTQVGAAASAAAAAPKQATLARSNAGCHRTELLCPRCNVPWGQKVEGNPDYFYNFMMEGLRCFTCATCLLNFGCLTAVHKCPFCRGVFEYSPEQYHRQVKCGNPGCGKQFGFMMFHASEQALRAAREQVRSCLERQLQSQEAKQGRAARAARRAGEADPLAAEKAFVMGLGNTCPRCGLELEDFEDGDQLRHLRGCTDAAAQRAHREREQQRAAVAKAAEAKAKAQLSAATGAVWSMSGGRAEQLWMLDVQQLKKRCLQEGLAAKGSREALIERLAERYASRGGGRGEVDLPANLHSLSEQQLAAVCAASGVKGLKSREERLEALEELRLEDEPLGALEDGRGARGSRAIASPAKAKALALEDKSPRSTGAGAKKKAKAGADGRARAKAQPKVASKAKVGVKAKPKLKVRSAASAPKAKAKSKGASNAKRPRAA